MRIAILSDTHGLLRPEIFPHLEGVDHVIHAGDVGVPDVLEALEAMAPVTAVWGNTDSFEVRARTREVAFLTLMERSVVVLHGHQLGSPDPRGLLALHGDADLIVYGHTHRWTLEKAGRTLVMNPGSCGPKRFDLPVTLGIADLNPSGFKVRQVRLV